MAGNDNKNNYNDDDDNDDDDDEDEREMTKDLFLVKQILDKIKPAYEREKKREKKTTTN